MSRNIEYLESNASYSKEGGEIIEITFAAPLGTVEDEIQSFIKSNSFNEKYIPNIKKHEFFIIHEDDRDLYDDKFIFKMTNVIGKSPKKLSHTINE